MKKVKPRCSQHSAAAHAEQNFREEIRDRCDRIAAMAELLVTCGKSVEAGFVNGRTVAVIGELIFEENQKIIELAG